MSRPQHQVTPVDTAELYRLLVESVRDYAIFALDAGGHVLSWNPGAERFKGYRPHEIIGSHFSVFYPEEDKWKTEYELRVATAEGRVEDEGWRVRKDGSRFWANVVITALRDEQGTLVGFAKVTRDLTERRAAEQRELENARRVALSEDANRAKSSFLAAMSHELRTPLNAIAGYADLLMLGVGGPVTEQQDAYLRRIRSSQQHLLAIINDILNYSRIEAGQLTYAKERVSLRGVVEAVHPMIEPQSRAKGLALELPGDGDVVVVADHARTEQVLLNLLGNAVKFTLTGGRISVGCEEAGGMGVLRVQDTGIGIAEADLPNILQPFVQLGRSLTSEHEGTGLGLAISSDMVQAMGGRITVESRLGEGSVFCVHLPLAGSTEQM